MSKVLAVTATAIAFALILRLPARADNASTIVPARAASPKAARAGSVDIPSDGKWHYSVAPYVYGPQINGTFQIPVRLGTGANTVTLKAHEPLGSYLPHINALGMVTGEARKDSGVVAFDYIWLNISTQKAGITSVSGPGGNAVPIAGNAGLRVTANIWTVAAGGTIAHSDDATIETLIGVRSLNLTTNLNWNSTTPLPVIPQNGTIAKSGTVNDAVIAVRGKVRVGSRFSVPYYFDGGYGSGSSTMQAAGGLAYAEPWGGVTLMYRTLIYNANPVSLNQRLTFNGLAIGTAYKL